MNQGSSFVMRTKRNPQNLVKTRILGTDIRVGIADVTVSDPFTQISIDSLAVLLEISLVGVEYVSILVYPIFFSRK